MRDDVYGGESVEDGENDMVDRFVEDRIKQLHSINCAQLPHYSSPS